MTSLYHAESYCRLCGSSILTGPLHVPESSKISLKIFQCENCGLTQGLCDEDSYADQNDTYKDPSLVLSQISCDSPYSNIRVGKQQMADKFFNIIDELPLDFSNIHSVCDVRSARGSFILKAPSFFLSASLFVGLEEDLYLHPSTETCNRSKAIILDQSVYSNPGITNGYDFIYSCHTLEHYRNPNKYIQNIKRLISSDGYFFVDVPSLTDFINADILDDFFYDKHLLYFTEPTLKRLLRSNGFSIIWSRSSGNGCIEMLCKLEGTLRPDLNQDSELACVEATDVLRYSQRLRQNRATLPACSQNIQDLINSTCGKSVAFGAGRILDAFRVYGNLDVNLFDYFIDNYLFEAAPIVNGLPIQRLSDLDPEFDLTFILFTRTKSRHLSRLIDSIYPSSTVLHWSELLSTSN
jgi:hypothetical protein